MLAMHIDDSFVNDTNSVAFDLRDSDHFSHDLVHQPIIIDFGAWSTWNGLSYTLSSLVKTKDEAELACNKFGSKLASIHSEEELEFVKTLLKSSSAWIGYKSI